MHAVRKVKFKAHLQATPQYLLVFVSLLITAWITGKYLESVCFAVSFAAFRYRFEDILHCNTTLRCMLLTNSIIFVCIPITIPLAHSLFGGLLTGFAVNYTANLIASDRFRREERKELEILRKERRCKDVYSLDEHNLRVYCKSFNLDPIDEEIVVQRLIYHLKGQDLYTKIGYSKPQMIRREKRIEANLNIKLKDH